MFGDDFDAYLERLDQNSQKKIDEFNKLALDPCTLPYKVGDRVVIAGGPIGKGFPWIRLEATVIEKGQISTKVRFTNLTRFGKVDEEWIHPALITDVLPNNEEE